MSDKETEKSINELCLEKDFPTGRKARAYHQYYSNYLIAVFVTSLLAIHVVIIVLYLQGKQIQALIEQQVAPLQDSFIQQSHLIKSTNLIDDILTTYEINLLVSRQQELTIKSKKLSLVNSSQQSFYQQWFLSNDQANNVVAEIASNQAENNLLKKNALLQLDTLLDAIEIEANKSEYDEDFVSLLISLRSELNNIVTRLQQLTLKSSADSLATLTAHVDKIFVRDYGKLLAVQQDNSRELVELVKDIIRFEDIILKKGLLIKWQSQLRLISDYQQQLKDEQLKLTEILNTLSDTDKGSSSASSFPTLDNDFVIAQTAIPLWLWGALLLSLVIILSLLYLIYHRLKASSEYGVKYLSLALEGADTSTISESEYAIVEQQSKAFYCAESQLLVQKIHQIHTSNYSEREYLNLKQECQELAEQVEKSADEQEKMRLELELLESNASSKSKSQLVLEQQRCKDLYITAIRQLVLISVSSLKLQQSTTSLAIHPLFDAYSQGRDLVRQLRQASCFRYLQTNEALLTLSDINLIAQVQAVLFNLESKFRHFENTVSLTIDRQVLPQVNVDAEIFTELYRVFIRLLLKGKTKKHLVLRVQLADKNSGQQKLNFSGELQSSEKIKQLPQELKSFNEASQDHSELGEYFQTILQYQHGEDATANLTKQGYQLSFTIPLALASNNQQDVYSALSFPLKVNKNKQVITKLTNEYMKMPVELLLAVNSPDKYQVFAQTLQAIGFQVTFTTNELMLNKYWQSGRFALLVTEIPCTPFSDFIIDELSANGDKSSLARGVFSLCKSLSFENGCQEFSTWTIGELVADGSVDDMLTVLNPWIKPQSHTLTEGSEASVINQNQADTENTLGSDEINVFKQSEQASSFNFNRYLKHQGSAELALYMLEEYTSDNIMLVESFAEVLAENETEQASEHIQSLAINAKILAADTLIDLCDKWQKILNNQNFDISSKSQAELLSSLRESVTEINLHAATIA